MPRKTSGPVITNKGGRPRVKSSASTPEPQKPFIKIVKASSQYFKDALALYDPENDPDAKLKQISYEELYERAHIPRKTKEGATEVMGTFVTQKMNGDTRLRNAKGWPEIDRLRESGEYKAMKLRETHGITLRGSKRLREAFPSDPFSFGEPSDPNTTVTNTTAPNDEFHPLLLGPFHRNLYIHDFLDQASKSFEAYHHNPVLKAGINAQLNFVMGDGPKVVANNPACQAAWDAYLDRCRATGITWEQKMVNAYRDTIMIGENFLTDPMLAGGPVLKLWDSTTVWEIITDPRDIENVHYAYRQFPTQYQVPYSSSGRKIPSIQEYVIEQVPPSRWLQVKVNATVGEKRGRSDLFPVLGWGKRFKDWFDAAVVNGQITNAFVVWWKINGDQADVDALKNNPDFSRLPPPGSAWFTNEQVTPSLLKPQGGLSTGEKTGEQLLSIIAVALGIPPEYLGVAGTSTRATALVRGEPAAKFFEQRQSVVREMVLWQYYRVIAHGMLTGTIPSKMPKRGAMRDLVSAMRSGDFKAAQIISASIREDQEYQAPMDTNAEVIMPSLEPEDRSAKLKDFQGARATNVFSHETYATQVAESLDVKDYDYDEEQKKIADERERGIVNMMTVPPSNGKPQEKFGDPASNQRYKQNNKNNAPGKT